MITVSKRTVQRQFILRQNHPIFALANPSPSRFHTTCKKEPMFRTVLLSILFGILLRTLSAQPAEGNWLLGGDMRFQVNLTEESVSGLTISPVAGYFVSDRLALGSGLGLARARQNGSPFASLQLSPFLRYYFPTADDRISFLLEGSSLYSFARFEDSNTSALRISAGGGINYFLTPQLALEALVSAHLLTGLGETPSSRVSYGLRTGLQVYWSGSTAADGSPPTSAALRKGKLLLGIAQRLTLNARNHRFEPTIAYLLTDRLALGAAASLPFREFRPQLRYFVSSDGQARLRPFAGVGSSLVWKSRTEEYLKIQPFAGAGALYFVSEALAVEGNLQYQLNLRPVGASSPATSSIIMASVGLQYLMGWE